MLGPMPSMADLGIGQKTIDRLLPQLDSFSKWELLRFLSDNPETEATIEDLARYTGRDETELKPAARALAAAGFLDETDSEFGTVFFITRDWDLRGLVADLVDGYSRDRLVRLAVSTHILQARRPARRLQYAS